MTRFATVLAAACLSAAAFAHTAIERSSPADGATLEAAPEELVLEFSAPVRLTAVSVRGADGAEHEIGSLPEGFAQRFSLPAPELGPGRSDVEWRALSEDTHVIEGAFAFTLEADASE